ncbi:hypothetical protein Cpir12675_001616 [Ceratocystis pirilliformis]|uniref:BHLH domain-containing protein n=1 Tax=Ceratocystis pirilliformis TaxID=259994 RepID=A0ABR3ZHR0_9PEZI
MNPHQSHAADGASFDQFLNGGYGAMEDPAYFSSMGISSGGAYSGIATQPPYNMATSTVDNRMFLGLGPVSQAGLAPTLNPLDINRTTTISTNTTGGSSSASWDPRSATSGSGYTPTPSGYRTSSTSDVSSSGRSPVSTQYGLYGSGSHGPSHAESLHGFPNHSLGHGSISGSDHAALSAHGADPRKRQHDSALAAEEKKRNAAQLRTASRAPKKQKPPVRRNSESFEESRAREAHNQVEQQYRHRLNSHFERLLATIPMSEYHGETDMMADEEGGSPDRRAAARAGIEKRISKAEVLEMGRTWIEKLTKECAELRSEVEELRAENKKLKGARLATTPMEWTPMKREWGGLD